MRAFVIEWVTLRKMGELKNNFTTNKKKKKRKGEKKKKKQGFTEFHSI